MLSDAQQQLLHAWVDGETTDAESRSAIELLARPEASEYVSTLKRLRELVARYAGVTAPAGLLERVRAALHRESRPVLSLRLWRTAALAAAAALVVSLGLVFGPSLLVEDKPQDVAVLDGPRQPIPAPEGGVSKPPMDPASTNPAPAPPGDERSVDDLLNGTRSGKEDAGSAVLRLDRGLGQPFELSVHMNRDRKASNLQVYNDMLIVSSLYGDAEIKDSSVESAEADEKFAGRDFSEFDGVAVEVEAGRVPELIAALNRMTADQSYGEVVVPNDLRQSIDVSAATVTELQRVSHNRPKTKGQPNDRSIGSPGARGYLPPDVQRECLEQELKDMPDELRKLSEMSQLKEEPSLEGAKATFGASAEHRKIKLILRLR
jgi:hypothetical protein